MSPGELKPLIKGRPLRLIRNAETNLGDIFADAYRTAVDADIGFAGGGGLRAGINKGDVTFNDILSVVPFGKYYTVLEVTGQQVLDALEWSVHTLPSEFGGFFHVSGLSFEYDSSIPTPCVADEKGMFDHVDELMERRVRNVLVAEKPIEKDAIYTLASDSYFLLDKGNGYTVFDGTKVLQTGEKYECEVFYEYIANVLGGHIGQGYENPYGEGRIVSVTPES